MLISRKASTPLYLVGFLVLQAVWGAGIVSAGEFEHIARNGDPVPGREHLGVVFSGRATQTYTGSAGGVLSKPAINDAGEVVFRARSSSSYDFNQNAAIGLYVRRPGEPLDVLVDTGKDGDGLPVYPVPGRGADACFSEFKPPLINNQGYVLFWASSVSPTNGSRTGFYVTTTTGGPIVKLVDNMDEVPGFPGQTFNRGFALGGYSQWRLLACMNDVGQIVLRGNFQLDTEPYQDAGIYSTTVNGDPLVRLVDTTETVYPNGFNMPFRGLSDGNQPALNNNGMVIFQGGIGNPPPKTVYDGVFTIPVDGSELATAQAIEGQYAPNLSDGLTRIFYSTFGGHDINDDGQFVFIHAFGSSYNSKIALFSGDLSGSPLSVLVDNAGGFDVPGMEGYAFTSFSIGNVNNNGELSFYAGDDSPNGQGIYATSLDGAPMQMVAHRDFVPPEREEPFVFNNFDGASAATNNNGIMILAPNGSDGASTPLYGLWSYSALAGLERIVDDASSVPEPPEGLGGDFFDCGSACTRFIEIYDGFRARAGHYRSINDNDEVAFLAAFGTFDVGIYVTTVGGGSDEPGLKVNLYSEVGEANGYDSGDVLIPDTEDVWITIDGIDGEFKTGDVVPLLELPTTVLVRRKAGGLQKSTWVTIPAGATTLDISFAMLEVNLYADGGGEQDAIDDPADLLIPNEVDFEHVYIDIDNIASDVRTGDTLFAPPSTSMLVRQRSYGLSKSLWYTTGAGDVHDLDVGFAAWNLRLITDADGNLTYDEGTDDVLIPDDVDHEYVRITIDNVKDAADDLIVWRTGDQILLPRNTSALVRQRAYGLTKSVWHTSGDGVHDHDVNFAAWDIRLITDADGNLIYDEGTDDVIIPNDVDHQYVRMTIDNVKDEADDLIVWRTGDRVILPRNTSALIRQRAYGLTKSVWHQTAVGIEDHDVNFAAWDIRLITDADGNLIYDEGTDDVLIPNDVDHQYVRMTIDNVKDEADDLIVWRTGDRVILPRNTSALVRQRAYGLTKSVWHQTTVGIEDHDVNFAAWDVRLIVDSDGNLVYDEGTDDVLIPNDVDHQYVRITIDNVKDEADELIVWRTGDRVILPRNTSALVRQRAYGLTKSVWHQTTVGIEDHDVNFAAWDLRLIVDADGNLVYDEGTDDVLIPNDVDHQYVRITIDNVKNEADELIVWRTGDRVILPRDTSALIRQRAYDLSKSVWHKTNVGIEYHDVNFAAWDLRLIVDADGNLVYDEGTDDLLIPNDVDYNYVRITIDNVKDAADELLIWRTGDRVILPRDTSALVRQRAYGLSKSIWHKSAVGAEDHDVNFAAWDVRLIVDADGNGVYNEGTDDLLIPNSDDAIRITIDNVKNAADELITWRTDDRVILPRGTSALVRQRAYGLTKSMWDQSDVGLAGHDICFAHVTFGCADGTCSEVTTIDNVRNASDDPIDFAVGDAVILPVDTTIYMRVDDGVDHWTEPVYGGFEAGLNTFEW